MHDVSGNIKINFERIITPNKIVTEYIKRTDSLDKKTLAQATEKIQQDYMNEHNYSVLEIKDGYYPFLVEELNKLGYNAKFYIEYKYIIILFDNINQMIIDTIEKKQ